MNKEKSYYTKEVSEAVREQMAKPLKKYLRIKADKVNEKWAVDLMDYNGFGFRYILCCVDIYSRKAGAWMMRSKTAKATEQAFKKLIDFYYNGSHCEQLLTDDGGEWKREFKDYCEKKNINIQTAPNDGSESKAHHNQQGHVERFIRTLRMLIKNFKEEEEQTTINERELKLLLKGYNNHPHRGLRGFTPVEVYEGEKIPNPVMYTHNILQTGFKLGDKVRVLLQKQTYANKKLLTYGKRVYVITGRNKNRFILDNGDDVPYTRLRLSKVDATEDDKKDVDEKRQAVEDEEKKKRKQKRLLDELK